MTVSRGLWVPLNGTAGTTDVEARLADAALFAENSPGVPRSGLLNPPTLVVTGTGTMNYSIAPCKPVNARTVGEGVYRWSIDGATTVPTTAAPGSNSRIDIIWTKQNDLAKGDADNMAIAGVSQGVAAAVPSPPVIPTGAVELARATVPALVTGTSSASIVQTFAHTALRGTPVPVRNATERGTITSPAPGTQVRRLDTTTLDVEEWSGTAWRDVTEAKGVRYKSTLTGPDTDPLAAHVVLMNVDNVVFKAGRHYRIAVEQNFYVTNTDTCWQEDICLAPAGAGAGLLSDLTVVRRSAFKATSGNRGFPADLTFTYAPAADETRQVKVTGLRVEGTGNFRIQRSPVSHSVLTVEDLGLKP